MTATPSPEEATVRLHKAMDAAVGLTPDDPGNVQSLIEVGEWRVAFETLFTQIHEWEIGLDPEVIRDLDSLKHVAKATFEWSEPPATGRADIPRSATWHHTNTS